MIRGSTRFEALAQHRRTLELHAERLTRLLHTIDRTIARLTEVDMSLTDEELYEGLPKEQVERWKREVDERYDPKLVAGVESPLSMPWARSNGMP